MIKSMVRSILLASAVALAGSAAARAESIQKTCGAEWQAAKTAGKVEAGATWPKFLSECRARHANDAAATTPAADTAAAAPAPAPAATAPPPAATTPAATAAAPAPAAPASTAAAGTTAAKPKSAGREAMLGRERQCGARWKEIKGSSQLPAGVTTWPKYWHWCNTQLKAGQAI